MEATLNKPKANDPIMYRTPSAKTVGLRSRGEQYVKDAAGKVKSTFTSPPIRLPFASMADGSGVFTLTEQFAREHQCTFDEVREMIENLSGYGQDIVRMDSGKVPEELQPSRRKNNLSSGTRGRKG